MEMTKEEFENFESELSQFTGTENYYKFSPFCNMVLTDGIKYLCDKLSCYWLMDIVASVQNLPKVKQNQNFILWKIKVNEDNSFVVSAYRDIPFNKANKLYMQKGKYTDFKIGYFEFYQINEVILLKSEY